MAPSTATREINDLTGMLKHAGHVLETRLAAALEEVDLTPRLQCVLIKALEGERTQIQLAELAHLDKTTMVSTVDALEAADWAQRKPSPTDRRARVIFVTPKGERKAREGQKIVDRVHAEALESLPKQSRASFGDLVMALADGGATAQTGIRRARTPK